MIFLCSSDTHATMLRSAACAVLSCVSCGAVPAGRGLRHLSVVPREALQLRFSRSSGPGGQHVNKVATKVEARFLVRNATWLTDVEKAALLGGSSNSSSSSGGGGGGGRGGGRGMVASRRALNRQGELVVTSQRSRSQARNIADCVAKIQAMVDLAGALPVQLERRKGGRRAQLWLPQQQQQQQQQHSAGEAAAGKSSGTTVVVVADADSAERNVCSSDSGTAGSQQQQPPPQQQPQQPQQPQQEGSVAPAAAAKRPAEFAREATRQARARRRGSGTKAYLRGKAAKGAKVGTGAPTPPKAQEQQQQQQQQQQRAKGAKIGKPMRVKKGKTRMWVWQ